METLTMTSLAAIVPSSLTTPDGTQSKRRPMDVADPVQPLEVPDLSSRNIIDHPSLEVNESIMARRRLTQKLYPNRLIKRVTSLPKVPLSEQPINQIAESPRISLVKNNDPRRRMARSLSLQSIRTISSTLSSRSKDSENDAPPPLPRFLGRHPSAVQLRTVSLPAVPENRISVVPRRYTSLHLNGPDVEGFIKVPYSAQTFHFYPHDTLIEDLPLEHERCSGDTARSTRGGSDVPSQAHSGLESVNPSRNADIRTTVKGFLKSVKGTKRWFWEKAVEVHDRSRYTFSSFLST